MSLSGVLSEIVDQHGDAKGGGTLRQLRLRSVPTVCGLAVGALGALVLVGWVFEWAVLVRFGTSLSSMTANTALCLVLLGAALILHESRRDRWAVGLGCAVAVVATATFGQYLFGLNLGIDTLLFGGAQRSLEPELEFPGRMAHASAVALTFLGVGLALARSRPRLSNTLAFGAIGIGYVALLGYAYGAENLHRVEGFTSVALPTAIAVIVAGAGIIWTRPEEGLLGLANSGGAVGVLVRPLCAFAIGVPPVIGSLRLVGEHQGFYDRPFGAAIMTLAWTAGVLIVTWLSARAAVSLEHARADALASSHAAEQRLSVVAQASALFASTLEIDQVVNLLTVRVAETLKDACSIRLFDESGSSLQSLMVHHLDPSRLTMLRDTLRGMDLGAGEGLLARVLQSREPLLVKTFDDSVLARIEDPQLKAAVASVGIRCLVIVPLVYRDKILGVVSVIRDQTLLPYDERDVELVVDIAARGAQALQNARLVAAKVRADASLAELGRLALAARDSEQLAREAAELAARTLPARYALFMSVGSEQSLSVTAVASPDGEAVALPPGAPIERGVPVQVFASGDPILCDDMRHDVAKGMIEMGHLLGTDSGMAVAVPGRLGRRGVLAVASEGLGRYTNDDLQFVEAYAALLGTALDRLDADADLRTAVKQREAMLGRLVAAQEEERGRIADGVHDDQVQTMAVLGIRLEMLHSHIAETNPDLLPDLDRVRVSLTGATERLRDLLFDLQPPGHDVDLAAALREAAARIFEHSEGTSWRVDSNVAITVSERVRIVAYRIVKEAMTNTHKHARATTVSVHLSQSEDGLEVSVVDDGIGVGSGSRRSPAGHRGLSSMNDRAAISGGWLRVDSQPGSGTSVRFWLPNTSSESNAEVGGTPSSSLL